MEANLTSVIALGDSDVSGDGGASEDNGLDGDVMLTGVDGDLRPGVSAALHSPLGSILAPL